MFTMEQRNDTAKFRSFVNGEVLEFNNYIIKNNNNLSTRRVETAQGSVADGCTQVKFAPSMQEAFIKVQEMRLGEYRLSSNHEGFETLKKGSLVIWAEKETVVQAASFQKEDILENVPYYTGTLKQERLVLILDWESLNAMDVNYLFFIIQAVS